MKSRIWIAALCVLLVAALMGGLGYRAYIASHEPQLTSQEQLRAGGEDVQPHMFFDIADTDDVVIAVGDAGQVRRSADQGKTWTPVATPTTSTLSAVAFASPEIVWAVGHQGVVLRSKDAGQSWQLVTLKASLPKDFAAFDVLFTEADTGYIVGSDGTLLTSSDSGLNWSKEDLPYRYASDHFYSVNQTGSGAIAITTSGGSILHRSAPDSDWLMEDVAWSRQALYGMLQRKDGSLLAFGAKGGVYQRAKDGEKWDKVKATSKADFYTGLIDHNGTVILAGSNGVIVRRSSGADTFLVDPDLRKGVVLALNELDDDTLFLAGQSGLGRQTPNGYVFQGHEAGTTGNFRRRQLLAMPITRHVLELNEQPSGYLSRSEEQDAESGWVQWQLAMRPAQSDQLKAQDLLSPGVYPQVAGFQEDLANLLDVRSSRLRSVWSGRFEVRTMGRHRPRPLDLTADPSSYARLGEAERRALLRRLEQGGYDGLYISKDYLSASFLVDMLRISDRMAEENGKALSQAVMSMPQDRLPFEIVDAQQFTLSVAGAPKPDNEEAAPESTPEIQAYSVMLNPEIRRCENQSVASAAMALSGPASEIKGTGAVLSAAGQASWNRAAEHDGSWKWFAPGATRGYGPPVYGRWEDDDCPGTLLIIYSRPGSGDLRARLEKVIDKTLSNTDMDVGPEDLVVKAYTLEKRPFPEGN